MRSKDDFNRFDKILTLVDMGADEYRITEYVNKYEFNKSYQLQLYVSDLFFFIALSFYRSQNVLGCSKFFVPDILWQSQTFFARKKR